MRKATIAAICVGLAACSGDAPEKKADAVPDTFPGGTWQVSSEVTAMRSTDKTTPAVKAAVGDKENGTVCVEKVSQEPAPALFSGSGYQCAYKSSYIKGGTLNAQLECHRAGLQGSIMMTVSGSYTAKDFDATVDAITYLSQPGRYRMSRKVHGTVKPGACTAAATGDDDEAEDGNASGQ